MSGFASYDGTEISWRHPGDAVRGELDPMVTSAEVRAAAPAFNDAAVAVQSGASHFPWIDGPAPFAATIGSFLKGVPQ